MHARECVDEKCLLRGVHRTGRKEGGGSPLTDSSKNKRWRQGEIKGPPRARPAGKRGYLAACALRTRRRAQGRKREERGGAGAGRLEGAGGEARNSTRGEGGFFCFSTQPGRAARRAAAGEEGSRAGFCQRPTDCWGKGGARAKGEAWWGRARGVGRGGRAQEAPRV